MKITMITVGKIKEKYFTMAIQEYAKRLQAYCRLEIIQVADERTPDKSSDHENQLIKEKEAERILRSIKEDAYVITLEIQGKQLSSEQLANKIQDLGVQGNSHICFIIGGSLGLHVSVCQRADFALSFSEMTFPHQLMRVILLEQIYRSFRIIHHQPYHK